MNAVAKRENREVRNHQEERSFVSPQVNIYETKDGYLLEADLPGVTKDGLEVTLENTTLTLVGRRAQQSSLGEVRYRESRPADFRRAFELDPSIDTARIHARMDQGVLFLELPKAEKVKPRKIKIAD
ncbi:MAG TPA: Hsp20/alpha crystallin family protein [Candidatus Saccharimonadales bacterium]|nr:Hsp20/alpha crystallin family protein [Candidatus Saccharimonadales bacterium]